MLEGIAQKLVINEDCWDTSDNPEKEVLGALAVAAVHTPFFSAYEMKDGKIYVVYMCVDDGGYCAMTNVMQYPNREAYSSAVNFVKS